MGGKNKMDVTEVVWAGVNWI